MAKKQTRRSISVSRTTYERLKNFCEANNISMSQFVETRVGDFLGGDAGEIVQIERPAAAERPRPTTHPLPAPRSTPSAIIPAKPSNETRPSAATCFSQSDPYVEARLCASRYPRSTPRENRL